MTTGVALSRSPNYEAARAFLLAETDETAAPRPILQRVPALLSHARVALSFGDLGSAEESLDETSRILEASSDFRAARLKADLLTLRASLLWAQGDLQASQRAMSDSLAAMGPERAPHHAAALLERARIRAASRSDLAAAQQDIEDATSLIRSRGLEGAQPLSAIETQMAFESTAALVSARAELQGSGGLAMSENLRLLLTGVLPQSGMVSPKHLEDAARRLAPATVAVIFLFGDQSLLSWTLAGGEVHYRQVPLDRRTVERHVARLSVQLARTPLRADLWTATLADLFDALLRDVPGGSTASEFIIVPDGPLRRVPFGALFDRAASGFLFDRATVRIVPSLTFGLTAPLVRQPEADVLAIGEPEVIDAERAAFPPLPHARAEAIQVSSLYPTSRTLVGASATKTAVLGELPKAGVLHFAGHAIGGTNGTPPRLLLAGAVDDPAAALSIDDLTNRLNGARIVLAACETAAADRTNRSVGSADLAGAFLRAGAASVVATLWKIDDTAGQAFFVAVHRGLAAGQSPARAVASVQRACRASQPCQSNPVTWVGTTVYGLE